MPKEVSELIWSSLISRFEKLGETDRVSKAFAEVLRKRDAKAKRLVLAIQAGTLKVSDVQKAVARDIARSRGVLLDVPRNRETKTHAVVLDAKSLDFAKESEVDGKYQVVCLAHSTLVVTDSRKMADSAARRPSMFCDECFSLAERFKGDK